MFMSAVPNSAPILPRAAYDGPIAPSLAQLHDEGGHDHDADHFEHPDHAEHSFEELEAEADELAAQAMDEEAAAEELAGLSEEAAASGDHELAQQLAGEAAEHAARAQAAEDAVADIEDEEAAMEEAAMGSEPPAAAAVWGGAGVADAGGGGGGLFAAAPTGNTEWSPCRATDFARQASGGGGAAPDTWSADAVAEWLSTLGLGARAPAFRALRLDGLALVQLAEFAHDASQETSARKFGIACDVMGQLGLRGGDALRFTRALKLLPR